MRISIWTNALLLILLTATVVWLLLAYQRMYDNHATLIERTADLRGFR